jgi:hypothetical protein
MFFSGLGTSEQPVRQQRVIRLIRYGRTRRRKWIRPGGARTSGEVWRPEEELAAKKTR